MLVMRGPSGFSGGQVLDALVSQIDIYPTVCALAGIALPDHVQGTSLLPLLDGQTQEIRREIFAEVNYHTYYEPQRCIRTPRFKYIRRFDQRQHPVMPNCDDSLTKDYFIDQGWRQRALENERLYDLVFDPHETHNLAADLRRGGSRTAPYWGLRPARNPQLGRRPQLPRSSSGTTPAARPMDARHRRPLGPRATRSAASHRGHQRSRCPLSHGAAPPSPRIFGHLPTVK